MKNETDDFKEGKEMFEWASALFPISRSIVGPGIDHAISFIKDKIPLNVKTKVLRFNSGKRVEDWTVPQAWELKRAYISDIDGKILVDSNESNLHIWSHSIPFTGTVSREELLDHLLIGNGKEIPYGTTYYRSNWGFSVTNQQFDTLVSEKYYVSVDTVIRPGSLSLLECVIPGKYKQEVFLSSYICHPSMANNELSGPVLMLALIRSLSQRNLNYTYRFVLGPETIGAISYLSKRNQKLQRRVWAALNLTCVGGKDEWNFLQSKSGSERIDNSIRKTFECLNIRYKEFKFLYRGSDERQYSSPKVGIPMASVMRSKYHEYSEYHTSKDDLSFINPKNLQESFNFYLKLIELLDNEALYLSRKVGEPFLSKWFTYGESGGLHPSKIENKTKLASNLIAYSNLQSLIEISDEIGECPFDIINLMNELVEIGLIHKSPIRPESRLNER